MPWMMLDTRQGGLRSVVPHRRWESKSTPQALSQRRQAECDIAASQARFVCDGEHVRERSCTQQFYSLPRTVGGMKPRVNVVWHKMSDLRVHDHEPLARAHLETSLPVVHLHVVEKF